jgi:hypothetical protein
MLLSSIIAGTEINHGKGSFGNYSSVLVPLCSNYAGILTYEKCEGQWRCTANVSTFESLKT